MRNPILYTECEGVGRRAERYDPATRTGVCPVCRAIRAAEVPRDELRLVGFMDYHEVRCFDWEGDE